MKYEKTKENTLFDDEEFLIKEKEKDTHKKHYENKKKFKDKDRRHKKEDFYES